MRPGLLRFVTGRTGYYWVWDMGWTQNVCLVLLITALVLSFSGCGGHRNIILATTTSTQDTGLLDALIPLFEEKTGYRIKAVAVGTGQALQMGRRGEADVLLVHAPLSEEELLVEGHVVNRKAVMYNDFVICGPMADPAGVRQETSATGAFRRIAGSRSLFVSRGDDSGTHKKEREIWERAGIDPCGTWYQESGSGMGQTLNIASEKGAYVLTDRGTFLALNKRLDLVILFEGDPSLVNIYHVMQVNPERHSGVNASGGKALVEFMVSEEVQKLIGRFGTDEYGEPVFFPAASERDEARTR